MDCFQRVLNLVPENGEVWGAMGHCYLMMDDLQKAYTAYQQALYHLPNPNEPKLWYGIGILYDRYGNLDHAEEAFASVVRMDPHYEKANEIYFRLGIIYKQQNQFDASLECFRYILDKPPRPLTEMDICFQIGHVYEQQQEFQLAKEAYERVLSENPDHAKVLQQLGWLYLQPSTGFMDQAMAVKLLSQSLESDPADPQTWCLLGRAYLSAQDYSEAYEAYQQGVYRDGKSPVLWCSIGILYYQINQFRDALGAYSRSIRLNPFIPEVWFNLGILYESCNNQVNDAIDAYRRAAELDPDNPQIQQRLHLLQSADAADKPLPSVPPPMDVHPSAYASAGSDASTPGQSYAATPDKTPTDALPHARVPQPKPAGDVPPEGYAHLPPPPAVDERAEATGRMPLRGVTGGELDSSPPGRRAYAESGSRTPSQPPAYRTGFRDYRTESQSYHAQYARGREGDLRRSGDYGRHYYSRPPYEGPSRPGEESMHRGSGNSRSTRNSSYHLHPYENERDSRFDSRRDYWPPASRQYPSFSTRSPGLPPMAQRDAHDGENQQDSSRGIAGDAHTRLPDMQSFTRRAEGESGERGGNMHTRVASSSVRGDIGTPSGSPARWRDSGARDSPNNSYTAQGERQADGNAYSARTGAPASTGREIDENYDEGAASALMGLAGAAASAHEASQAEAQRSSAPKAHDTNARDAAPQPSAERQAAPEARAGPPAGPPAPREAADASSLGKHDLDDAEKKTAADSGDGDATAKRARADEPDSAQPQSSGDMSVEDHAQPAAGAKGSEATAPEPPVQDASQENASSSEPSKP